jgi:hypothetical protein
MGKNWIPLVLWLIAAIWSVNEAHGSGTRALPAAIASASQPGAYCRLAVSPSHSLEWSRQRTAAR